jgi:hypothetical protein
MFENFSKSFFLLFFSFFVFLLYSTHRLVALFLDLDTTEQHVTSLTPTQGGEIFPQIESNQILTCLRDKLTVPHTI